MIYRSQLSRWSPLFRSAVLAVLVAMPIAPISAQDLPIVPGVALLHAENAQNCVSGNAPLDDVLEGMQSRDELRAISMAWSDITPLLEDEKTDLLVQPDGAEKMPPELDPDTRQPTVHRFPDDRIYKEIAICADPTINEAPEVKDAPGRIWALNVSGTPSKPQVALPDGWEAYVFGAAASNKTLSTCLLMGGALPRQPATAAEIASSVETRIEESLQGLPSTPHVHDSRLASGLFHPGAFRMRGWDLVFLAGLSEGDASTGTACEELTEELLQEDEASPSLGLDPQEALSSCPNEGLNSGQAMRQRVLFEENGQELGTASTDLLAEFQNCAVLSLEKGTRVFLTIEAYGSEDGSPQSNWAVSKSRATALLDAFKPIGIPTVSGGFGESEMFADDQQGNRVAFVTLNAGPILSPRNGSIDSALLRRYLEPNNTCRDIEDNLTSDLLPYLTSPFGKRLLDALNAPDFVVMFHNAQDSLEFARDLQTSAEGVSSCRGAGDTTHVGFLYKRTGAPFWQDATSETATSEQQVTDYFVLPPKITWIYPIDENADYSELAKVAEEFGIVSQNLGRLSDIADLDDDERNDLLGQVDVLTVTVPTPISTVLQHLDRAKAGTGWVNLTAGWD